MKKIEAEIREALSKSQKQIKDYIAGADKFDKKYARSAVLDKIGRKLFGWQKSFSFSTDAQVFRILDNKISDLILTYEEIVGRHLKNAPKDKKMTALGITNTEQSFLADLKKKDK